MIVYTRAALRSFFKFASTCFLFGSLILGLCFLLLEACATSFTDQHDPSLSPMGRRND